MAESEGNGARERPRRARLVDVARAAGTSPPIASRILNRDPKLSVGTELRERVLRAAKELGYRPHAVARSLRLGEARAVGMLVPSLMNPVYTHFIRGAFMRAATREFTVLLAEDIDEQHADEAFARLVVTGRIDGLAIASARPGHTLPPLLAEHEVPHVFVNRAVPGSGRNVTMDDARGARLAIDHLYELGHRRIVHLGGPPGVEPAERRAAAVLARAAELGIPEPPVLPASFEERGGAEALDRILAAAPDATAVYTSTVSQASGLLYAAWRAGIAIPDRLSVVTHADMPHAEVLVPPVTAVHMPLEELGAAGVDALLDQIQGGTPRDVVVDIAPTLVLRASSAPPP
jgi:LacI family transcriptional regulator